MGTGLNTRIGFAEKVVEKISAYTRQYQHAVCTSSLSFFILLVFVVFVRKIKRR